MRRRGVIARLVAIATMALPGGAVADVPGHDVNGALVSGPVLAGSRIVWIEDNGHQHLDVLSMPAAGGMVRRERWLDALLRRAERKSDYEILIDGSDKRRAALVNWQHPDAPDVGPDADISFTFTRMVTAPAGGAPNALTGCTSGVSDLEGSAISVSGNVVAWLSECESVSEIRVLDFDRGRSPRALRIKASRGRYFADIQLAGRYVLSFPTRVNNFPYPDAAEVYDIRTGRRVRTFGSRRNHVGGAAVDRDGRLAVTTSSVEQQDSDCTPAIKAVVVDRDGRQHRLGGRPCFADVQINGGRVLLRRFAGDYRGPLLGPYGESTLTTHDLIDPRTGDGRPVTTPFVTDLEYVIFAGDRIAYTVPRCTGRWTIGSVSVRAALRRPFGPDLCTGRIHSTAERQSIASSRRIRAQITCPKGCSTSRAALRVWDPAERRHLQVEGEQSNPDGVWVAPVSAPPGKATQVSLALSEGTARDLRARGSTHVEVQLIVVRYDGSTQVSSTPVEVVP